MNTMNSMNSTNSDPGLKLLHAVERVIDHDEIILADARRHWAAAYGVRDLACRRTVSEYSNKSAIAGALSAAPGIIPGYGTAAVIGASVLEMAYVLKTEVEMCLSLCAMFGLDIRVRENRQIGFLLAAVGTHEVASGRNPLYDFGAVGFQAVWSYTPREVSKMLLRVLSIVAALRATKALGCGVLRAIPVVGVGIGAGLNKALTTRVGDAAHQTLSARLRAVQAAG